MRNRNAIERRQWRPVLVDDVRSSAMETVLSIAQELKRRQIRNATLASGQSGVALFFAYLAAAKPGRDYEDVARRFLDRSVHALATRRMSTSLYSGLTGVAWTAIHLKRLLGISGVYPNAAIDRALNLHFRSTPRSSQYDLISGLTGIAVYALECLPQNSAITLLKRVVDHLDKNAERKSDGCTWITRSEWLPADRRETYPDGCYDFGVAHGVPGVIAVLGRICATREPKLKATRATARKLLNGAVKWLLSQKSTDSNTSVFPTCVNATAPKSTGASRLAWCYGDLGIASALFTAARSVKATGWETEALSLAHRAAHRLFKQSAVNDTGLCHGAAGVAHLFNRLYQATGDRTCRDAARRWFGQTIKMRRPRYDVAGFPARLYKPSTGLYWSAEPGVLEGAAGVGLALLSAATSVEPAWDRITLISTR
jgi:lantibiotic modifying enzyme